MQLLCALVFLIFTLSCVSAVDVSLDTHWILWTKIHQKRYSAAEEPIRRASWEANLKTVQDHNLLADLGVHTFRLGMNQFADLTVAEFIEKMNGYNTTMHTGLKTRNQKFSRNLNVRLPDTVDWRDKGYVTPVKDQGQCTGGWAFSTTGALEGQQFNATGKLVALSEQNLIDCSGKQGNMGCVGGTMDQAFQYIKENGGIDTEESYPYEDDDNRCRFQAQSVGATVKGLVDIRSKDESALQEAIATIGPVSVTIDTSHSSFQLYKQGVYHEPFCSQIHLDHAALAVGYGTESGKDYWLVKNSWGVGWGEQGYIKMTRNRRNECGIATSASYPVV